MSDFLSMGGYAAYVWPAYGLSAGALLGLAFWIWRRGRVLKRRLREIEARKDGTQKDGAQS
ncbi:MAG: heme exporter protein CcmD [Amphiplicatus sp.]